MDIKIAPSFYASLEKLSEEEKTEVMKVIADLSEMTAEEIKAISKPVCSECHRSECTCD